MGKLEMENGFVRAAVLVFVLVLVLVALYLMDRRDVDVSGAGKTVAGLENAAEAVQESSKAAILTAKVKTALALSKSSSAFEVDVDSEDGAVTLTGVLPSSEAKAAILQIARDTDGVVEVVDRLTVETGVMQPRLEDLQRRLAEFEIEIAVYERLLRSERLDARSIRVSVEGRVVRLSGSVPDALQRQRAEELVASVEGVASVRNELEIAERGAGSRVSPPPETTRTPETFYWNGAAASKVLPRIPADGPSGPSPDERELRAPAMAP
jgi:hyperosmotically inducible protein